MTGTDLPPGASPASGARGPVRDLLAVAGELLSPRLVAPATLAVATAVAFAGLPGVLPGFGRYDPCDWGLGFEIRDAKAPPLDGRHQLTGHVRPLRPVWELRVGGPRGPGGVRGAVRPGLRPVGAHRLAGVVRRRRGRWGPGPSPGPSLR